MAGPSYGNPFSRRRRQNAVDGSVPGTSPPRFHRGAHFAGAPSPADLTARMVRVDLPHPSEEYDPVHSEYPDTPAYDPPEPWDAISLENPTPPLRLDPPELSGPRPPSYRRSVAFARRIEPLIQRFLELRAAGEPIPIDLANLYDAFKAAEPRILDSYGIGASPISPSPIDVGPDPGVPSMIDPSLDALALEMTTFPMEEMATHQVQERSAAGIGPVTFEPSAGPMEMNLLDMAEAMMPGAEPPSAMEAPMMIPSDPIVDSPAMTLDALVEQMMPEPSPPPEEPDPFMLMQLQFNQQMQMMDPFNMPGPTM